MNRLQSDSGITVTWSPAYVTALIQDMATRGDGFKRILDSTIHAYQRQTWKTHEEAQLMVGCLVQGLANADIPAVGIVKRTARKDKWRLRVILLAAA